MDVPDEIDISGICPGGFVFSSAMESFGKKFPQIVYVFLNRKESLGKNTLVGGVIALVALYYLRDDGYKKVAEYDIKVPVFEHMVSLQNYPLGFVGDHF